MKILGRIGNDIARMLLIFWDTLQNYATWISPHKNQYKLDVQGRRKNDLTGVLAKWFLSRAEHHVVSSLALVRDTQKLPNEPQRLPKSSQREPKATQNDIQIPQDD